MKNARGFFNKGALTTLTATEPGGLFNTIAYNYDLMGRNVNETRTIDGVPYTTLRQYDLAGRLDIITYPDGATKVDYDYNPMGNLENVYQVEADQTRTLLAEYGGFNAMGQIGSKTYGNGNTTSYEYWPGNHRLRYMNTAVSTQGDSSSATPPATDYPAPGAAVTNGVIHALEYHFDDLGNVETITDGINGASYEFDYDSVSRLTHAKATCAADPDLEYDQTYTYDLAGNMSAKTGKGGFKVQDWQDAQKHIRPASVLFQLNNPGVGQRGIAYNQDNKPTEITFNGQTVSLVYDGEGNRVKKVGGGQSTIYVGGLYEISGGQAVAHIFVGGKRIVSIKAGHKFYIHSDHLGSTSMVTDENGLRVEEVGYLRFGATLYRKAYNNGTWTSVYRFTGQEFDAEYALYNYNSRLYDPVMGRFITADTVVPDWTDPQSLNRYSYCRNNPLIYVDPSGHGCFLASVIVLAMIGAFCGGFSAVVQGGDVGQGMLYGGISGAVSGAMFYYAGDVIGGKTFLSSTKISSHVAMAGVHAVAGASSGAVSAAICGGDVGRAALAGAVSGGAAKYACEAYNFGPVGRIVVGAGTGGVSSAISGGDFGLGAIQGAWNSAIE